MAAYKNDFAGIYCWQNTINGKRYIGSSFRCRQRKDEHICALRNQRANVLFQNSWNKYINKLGYPEYIFEWSILEYCDNNISNNEIVALEQKWCDFYKSNNNEFGYNLRKDCTNNKGFVQSESAKAKMSINHNYSKSNRSKGIVQIDRAGNIIEVFKSWKDATDKHGPSIKYNIKNNCFNNKGFNFIKEEDVNLVTIKGVKSLSQIDIDRFVNIRRKTWKLSEERVKQLVETNSGKFVSSETKQKLSNIFKGCENFKNRHAVIKMDENYNVIAEFKSCSEAWSDLSYSQVYFSMKTGTVAKNGFIYIKKNGYNKFMESKLKAA